MRFFVNFLFILSQCPFFFNTITKKHNNHRGMIRLRRRESNQQLWVNMEDLAGNYALSVNKFTKDILFQAAFQLINPYINRCAMNAVRKAQITGVYIPQEDFSSYFYEALWKAMEAYDIEKGNFKSFLCYRFRIAEAATWREYESRDRNGKNGKTYTVTRWESLNKKVGQDDDLILEEIILGVVPSSEEVVVDQHTVVEMMSAFSHKQVRYANVIELLSHGYQGEEIARAVGYNEYSPRIRKLVQRSKQSFRYFLDEWYFNMPIV